MTTAELKPGPKTTTLPNAPAARPEPTNDELVSTLMRLDGDINAVLRLFNLSPDRFLAFANDPKVLEVLAAFDALNDRRWRLVARRQQETAATHLTKALEDSPGPVETRRAATALARLAANMLKDPAPRLSLRSKLAALADEVAQSRPEPPTRTAAPASPPHAATPRPATQAPPTAPHTPRTTALPAA